MDYTKKIKSVGITKDFIAKKFGVPNALITYICQNKNAINKICKFIEGLK